MDFDRVCCQILDDSIAVGETETIHFLLGRFSLLLWSERKKGRKKRKERKKRERVRREKLEMGRARQGEREKQRQQHQIMQCRSEQIPERGPATLEKYESTGVERVILSPASDTGGGMP